MGHPKSWRPAFPPLSRLSLVTVLGLLLASAGMPAQADDAAAKSLFRDNDCNKCHHPSKTKKGPSLKTIAERHKGDAGAEGKLVKHITSRPKVKIEGVEEVHPVPDTKDSQQLHNLIRWMLAQ